MKLTNLTFPLCLCRLVDGIVLRKWRDLFKTPATLAEVEDRTKEVAVQLLEVQQGLKSLLQNWSHTFKL